MGQPIAVLEAMKMETNIISPMTGIIEELCVKEGATVAAGELVAKLRYEK